MILIAKDQPWPEYQEINHQGIPITVLRSAKTIVMDGLFNWMRQSPEGNRPTHILLPVRLEAPFKASLNWPEVMMMANAWDKTESELCGMKLILVQTGALELLGDMPT